MESPTRVRHREPPASAIASPRVSVIASPRVPVIASP